MDNTKLAALVTGASSGIGYELAKRFARNGHNLVLVARDRVRLESLAAALRRDHAVEVLVITQDLALASSPEAVYREVRERGIRVAYLVNNAGFGMNDAFLDMPLQTILGMIQVNIGSLTHLTKLFLPDMVDRKFGRVLNVASTAAYTPGPFLAVYFASKAYVLSFSEAMAEEMKGTGVTVTALCPGPTQTEFAERAGMTHAALFRFGAMTAHDVAATGYRAMMAGRASIISGLANRALVSSIRFFPRAWVTKITRILSDARLRRGAAPGAG